MARLFAQAQPLVDAHRLEGAHQAGAGDVMAGRPEMSVPASTILPPSRFWKPEMQSIAVLLPKPLDRSGR